MKVRFLTLSAGPSGVIHPGDVVDVSVDTAAELVLAGSAVAVERATVAPQALALAPEATETATVQPAETAARRGRKARG